MRLRRLVPRARPLAIIALAAALVATIVVAWRQPGFAQVPPLRDDRAVWVVNDARLLVGRVNTRIGELDSAALTSGVSEVLQDPVSSGAGRSWSSTRPSTSSSCWTPGPSPSGPG